MQDFPLYFQLGLTHILDWQGYDHILFVIALCSSYSWQNWRKSLILVTAFTIGHSLTLALSVLNLITVSAPWIEFLIPVTIVITGLVNIFRKNHDTFNWYFIYLLTLLFGLIHGLGFSNNLKSLLGKEYLNQLLAFNVGLEVGQLAIVVFTMALTFLINSGFKISPGKWSFFLSTLIVAVALTMALTRFRLLLAFY